jgi:uncharacterized repeat protein (TIGR03803 family)
MRHIGSRLNRRSWFAGARPSAVAGALACAVACLLSQSAAPLAQAQNYSVVYSFQCGTLFGGPGDGQNPRGDLIADSAGNLYGTTQFGGANTTEENPNGAGTVFEVSAAGDETVLHSFGGAVDGYWPVAGLVRDSAGDLFGTTFTGTAGSGTVFEVYPNGVEAVLHNFSGGKDEGDPAGSLLLDSAGNLYGTTAGVDTGQYGTVFKLAPDGKITELHTFAGSPNDGAGPAAGLIHDGAGNLYGTTANGGTGGDEFTGTVFEVSKGGVETILYNFTGNSDGGSPEANLIRDSAGNLYGTTVEGGDSAFICEQFFDGCGTVFKVTPEGQETVLYSFTGGDDGGNPLSDLLMDGKGNLYGTASGGGSSSGLSCTACGVVFEVTPTGKERVLHSFPGMRDDGEIPYGGLLRVENYLYGTTYYGGTYGCGTVYKIAP